MGSVYTSAGSAISWINPPSVSCFTYKSCTGEAHTDKLILCVIKISILFFLNEIWDKIKDMKKSLK